MEEVCHRRPVLPRWRPLGLIGIALVSALLASSNVAAQLDLPPLRDDQRIRDDDRTRDRSAPLTENIYNRGDSDRRFPPDDRRLSSQDDRRFSSQDDRRFSQDEDRRFQNDDDRRINGGRFPNNDDDRRFNNRYPDDDRRIVNGRFPNGDDGRRIPTGGRFPDDDRRNQGRFPQDDRRYPLDDERRIPTRYPGDDDRRFPQDDRGRYPQDDRRYPLDDDRYSTVRPGERPFGGGPLRDEDRFDPNGRRVPEVDYTNLLASLDFIGTQRCSANVAAQWNYETNVNEVSQLQALQAQRYFADFQFQAWLQIKEIDPYTVRDPTTRRRLRYLSAVGPAALPPDQLDRYNRIINDMLSIYNSGTICAYKDPLRCGLRLYPEISTIMARSRDWDELQWVWLEWRRRSGSQIKELYQQLVDLNNEAARMNNFTDAAEYWQFPYESYDFEREIDEVWEGIRPLYEELHAYVRKRLRDRYGPEKINGHAPLPSHILGNIWGQSWSNILDMTMPYPGKNYLDATEEMILQGYTPIDMFRVGEDFFLSMNLSALPPEFWAGSLIADPGDRPLICQASAWDFCNHVDYRIKMCTRVTMKDLITVHHEMAHIQYFLRYSHLPREFRDGANPGFHEAVGEAVALSVATPKHLQTLGLANKYVDERPADINYLFTLAMEKLVLLPYSIALDKWRWDVFRGKVNRYEYNCHWHRLKETYSGTKPPVLRSEDDFDPGSKYHIPANIPYIRNFVAGVLQFQLYRSLCQAAGQRNPENPRMQLHRCDFYRSAEAGKILGKLMERGTSRPWQEVLYEATGESRLDPTAIREFFQPLEDWLRAENFRTNELVGWTYDGDYCKRSIETVGLEVLGSGYYSSASRSTSATWLLMLLLSAATTTILVGATTRP